MLVRNLTIGLAAAALAVPMAAQDRGTMELGGYVSRTAYDDNLLVNSAFGLGARVGMFINPRLSFEVEAGVSPASRPLGLPDVNVANTMMRLTWNPIRAGRMKLLLGAGLEHTDTYQFESYGLHLLGGVKFALSERSAFRVDGIFSDLEGGLGTNKSLHVGLSVFRKPNASRTDTVHQTTMMPAPMPMAHSDSVSAAETRRLRAAEANLNALRDSLARGTYTGLSSAAALAIMNEMVFFEREKFNLSDSAKQTLDRKVPIFAENPRMRIIITGYASEPGTDDYNMLLGLNRARAARDYLISKGVNTIRIEISTRGERAPIDTGTDDQANATNRRAQFRLLLAATFLERP